MIFATVGSHFASNLSVITNQSTQFSANYNLYIDLRTFHQREFG